LGHCSDPTDRIYFLLFIEHFAEVPVDLCFGIPGKHMRGKVGIDVAQRIDVSEPPWRSILLTWRGAILHLLLATLTLLSSPPPRGHRRHLLRRERRPSTGSHRSFDRHIGHGDALKNLRAPSADANGCDIEHFARGLIALTQNVARDDGKCRYAP
jgi:hypothetical protein